MASSTDISGTSSSLAITSECFAVLNALIIMTRSMHNCKVLGYYGGIQKLTALVKGMLLVCYMYVFCLMLVTCFGVLISNYYMTDLFRNLKIECLWLGMQQLIVSINFKLFEKIILEFSLLRLHCTLYLTGQRCYPAITLVALWGLCLCLYGQLWHSQFIQ